MLQHCNCIMGKGRCVCVGGWGGEGGLQFYIFFFFFSYCRNLAFNHVNFYFPAMFFSPSALHLRNDSDDE